MVKGIPVRMKMLGLRVISARTREPKLCPAPDLNGLTKTPLTTKLCRTSRGAHAVKRTKDASVARSEGSQLRCGSRTAGCTRLAIVERYWLLNVKPVIHLVRDFNAHTVADLALNSEIGLNRVVVLVVRIQVEQYAARRAGCGRDTQGIDVGLSQDAE